MVANKTNSNEISMGITLWYSIHKCRGYIKTNACVKQALYNCVLNHTQVVHTPIELTDLKCLLMVKLKNRLYLTCYLRCIPENHTTVL